MHVHGITNSIYQQTQKLKWHYHNYIASSYIIIMMTEPQLASTMQIIILAPTPN